jgi:hypothetical protein
VSGFSSSVEAPRRQAVKDGTIKIIRQKLIGRMRFEKVLMIGSIFFSLSRRYRTGAQASSLAVGALKGLRATGTVALQSL